MRAAVLAGARFSSRPQRHDKTRSGFTDLQLQLLYSTAFTRARSDGGGEGERLQRFRLRFVLLSSRSPAQRRQLEGCRSHREAGSTRL
jgi:hypothetical protein